MGEVKLNQQSKDVHINGTCRCRSSDKLKVTFASGLSRPSAGRIQDNTNTEFVPYPSRNICELPSTKKKRSPRWVIIFILFIFFGQPILAMLLAVIGSLVK